MVLRLETADIENFVPIFAASEHTGYCVPPLTTGPYPKPAWALIPVIPLR